MEGDSFACNLIAHEVLMVINGRHAEILAWQNKDSKSMDSVDVDRNKCANQKGMYIVCTLND